MEKTSEAPVDKFRLIYLIFGWLGIGTLLPWNMFITVSAYWNYKWRSTGLESLGEANDIQTGWGSSMSMASMIPNVTFLLLNATFGHHFKTTPRLLVSLILVILLFGVTCAFTKIETDEWQDEFWYITIVSIVLININSAIFQGGLLGLAGKFPPQYMGITFGGQALGGIFASVTNVVVILLGVEPQDAAFFCFLIAVVFLATALVCFLVATRSEFFQYYLDEKKSPAIDDNDPEELKGKFLQNDSAEVEFKQKVSPWYVFRSISLYGISVFLVFAVTLACFPSVTMLVQSSTLGQEDDNIWGTKLFIPVCCFVLFNVGDWLGRFAAELIQWPKPGKFGMIFIFVMTLLRIGFIPLFLFCNAPHFSGRALTWVVFDNDAYYISFMALFSLSNGYLSNNCMMSAPQLCKGKEAATASSMMVALLGLGLGVGSLLSYPVKSLL